MIEFSGEMSNDCKQYILNCNKTMVTKITFVVALIVSIPIIISIFTWNWIMVIAIPGLILFVVLAGIRPKDLSLVVPERVFMDDEELTAKSEKFHVVKYVSDVKKVIDMGEWYHISFSTRPFYINFVCQKNLIKQGTIEEFENLFKDKIIREEKNGLSSLENSQNKSKN